jgi:hypothetical protein
VFVCVRACELVYRRVSRPAFLVRQFNLVQTLSILLFRDTFFLRPVILWHIDPLLDNDREIISYTKTVVR